MLDPLEPSAVLGGEVDPTSAAKKKKKGSKKSRKKQMKEGSHCDAVLSLSWNPVYRQLLARHTHTHTIHHAIHASDPPNVSNSTATVLSEQASGSADCSVKVWDVTSQTCKHTFTHHSDKVGLPRSQPQPQQERHPDLT